MKRLLVAMMFLIMAFPVLAQDEPAWDVVVYEPTTGVLYSVTAGGIQAGANLSDMLQFTAVSNFVLTPERDYLVFVGYNAAEDGTSTSGLYVAETSGGVCCRPLIDRLNSGMDSAIIGGLSPDGTQVLVLLYNFASAYGSGEPVESLVTTFDIASGNVTGNLGVRSLVPMTAGVVDQGVMFGGWQEDGIRLVSSCLACEPALTGLFQIWQPATGELSEPVEAYDLTTQQLFATGEGIKAAQNTAFPYQTEQVTPFPAPNVIEYYPDSVTTTPQVIFFNPANLHIAQAHWILDGQAVLVRYLDAASQVQPSTEAHIVYRDGRSFRLDIPLNQALLAGTPDGWLMTDFEAKAFVNYTVADFEQVEVEVVDNYSGDYVLLVQPATLGTGITEKTFAPFPAP